MLKLSSIMSASLLAALAASGVALSAGMMGPQQTLHMLVGRWTCVTVDNHHKTFREIDNDSMYGPWLRMDAMYPAQNGQPAATGMTFMSYDAKHHRWIIGGFDTSGGYFISYSTSPSFNGSHWSDGYPATGGWANVSMPGNNRYTIDTGGSSMGTTHTVCTRG